MSFATAPDGVRLHFEVAGAGPPLFLHPGAGCDATLWQATGYVDELSDSYSCILFDHRGHGNSDRPRGWEQNTVDNYVHDVLAVADQLQLGGFGFWGYSSAVDVGIRLAQAYPQRVRALVGSGGVVPSTRADDAAWARGLAAQLQDGGWEPLLNGFDGQEGQPVPDWMKQRIRDTDVQQFIDWLGAVEHAQWHYWEALPDVRTPSLFLVGEKEDPDDETAQAVALMPVARRHILPDAGHIQAFLDAGPALRVVTPFLAQHLATAGY